MKGQMTESVLISKVDLLNSLEYECYKHHIPTAKHFVYIIQPYSSSHSLKSIVEKNESKAVLNFNWYGWKKKPALDDSELDRAL